MQRVGGKLQVVELKTSSSRRTVVLPGLAVRHLEEHKKRQDAERQALGEAWREHGLVFASSIGTPIEPRNVNRRWDEVRRRAASARRVPVLTVLSGTYTAPEVGS